MYETKNINYNSYLIINLMSQDSTLHKQKFNTKDIKILPKDPQRLVEMLESYKEMHMALISTSLMEMVENKL
jgi:2-phosphoglycerate kinase